MSPHSAEATKRSALYISQMCDPFRLIKNGHFFFHFAFGRVGVEPAMVQCLLFVGQKHAFFENHNVVRYNRVAYPGPLVSMVLWFMTTISRKS